MGGGPPCKILSNTPLNKRYPPNRGAPCTLLRRERETTQNKRPAPPRVKGRRSDSICCWLAVFFFAAVLAVLDGGARLAGEAVLVHPGAVPLVVADVAARTAVLTQGEVVAVHHAWELGRA